MAYHSKIIGLGSAFPERAMTNAEFEKFIDTSDEWIRTRTGIEQRYIADRTKGETTLSLCHAASLKALDQAGIKGEDLDAILIGTVTPDNIMPTTANQLQALLGANKAFSFDLQAACAGYLYALSVADHFIRGGTAKNILVLGAETLSTVVNWRDRTTCVLFGDGAGATVVQRTEDPSRSVLRVDLHSDGRYASLLQIPHGYARVPPNSPEYRTDHHKIQMQGGEVFKIACRSMVESSKATLDAQGVKLEDVDFFLFHQANIRIIDMCLSMLGVGREKTWINVQKYGNTSAATLPVGLDEALKAGKVKPGQLVLMATFGGGLTWASALIRV
jgi:3-oxoacyl-[acyl-carrier-protein] synthase III